MPAGRPREVSFSPEEMIKLGEEMVEWVKKNKPIHLSVWYTQEKDFTDEQWDTFRKRKEFVHYYTKALKLVGYSYLDKDSQIDVRLKDRWQRVYFKDLREQEDEDAEKDAERKKAIENTKQTTYTIVVPHGLASGADIPAAPLPDSSDNSPKQGN